MELWDAYDRGGSALGFDLVRGEPLPDGVCHLVSEVVVRHADGDFLLMLRDERKESLPGRWECSAAGSALKGEDAAACAKRELCEETGVDRGSFTEVGTVVTKRVIYRIFLCETDFPKDAIRLQEGETTAFRWVTPATLTALMDAGEVVPERRCRIIREMLK